MGRESNLTPRVTLKPEEQKRLDEITGKLAPHIFKAGFKGVSGFMQEFLYDKPIEEILTEAEIRELGRLKAIKVYEVDPDSL